MKYSSRQIAWIYLLLFYLYIDPPVREVIGNDT